MLQLLFSFTNNIHYKFKSSKASKVMPQSSKHAGAKQNLTQNGHLRSHVLESVKTQSGSNLNYPVNNLCKKLHSLYKLCKGDIVVGDIKLQRSPLQNSNFVITLSVGFVLKLCNGEVGIL